MFNITDLVNHALAENKDISKLIPSLAYAIDNNKDKHEVFSELYEVVYGHHLSDKYCSMFVDQMYCEDGKGKKWTLDQTNDIARKIGISFTNDDEDYTQYEFWCVMHMMYYDYHSVMVESGISEPAIYGKLADAYLSDPDAPQGKLVNYFFFNNK